MGAQSNSPRPGSLWLGFTAFALVGGVVATNVFCLQQTSRPQLAEERSRKRPDPEADRQRRLALAPQEARAHPSAPPRKPGAVVEMTAPEAGRVGRFSPPAARAGVMQLADEVPDARDADMIRAVQRTLADRGYEPGSADGVLGAATRAAIMAYEHDHGLPITADVSEPLLAHLQPGTKPSAIRAGRPGRMPHAEQLVRSVQQSLTALGYFAGRIDGWLGQDTVRAIREYEVHVGLPPTGRISAPLLARIDRSVQNTGLRPGLPR
jgi:Putative peptidoglycan binding domain